MKYVRRTKFRVKGDRMNGITYHALRLFDALVFFLSLTMYESDVTTWWLFKDEGYDVEPF